MQQRADHGFLDAVDVFLDEVARALQVQQRVGHHLPGAVVRHLPAAVGRHHGDVAGVENVLWPTCQALRVHRRVLAHPHHIGCVLKARRRERLHGCVGGLVVHAAQKLDLHAHGYSTTLTIGWVDSVR